MTLNEKRPRDLREELSVEDFAFFRRFIHKSTGIDLSESKKYLLEGKLRQNLPDWGFTTFRDFRQHIACHPDDQAALLNLGNAVSINKTDFFRDPAHFRYLTERVVPQILSQGSGRRFTLKAWSAGCATGKEPYTLAMVLEELAAASESFSYSVLATDLSTRALEKAERGIYPSSRVTAIPENLKKKYLLRSRDPHAKQVRIAPALRNQVDFRQLNFMAESYPVQRDMDVIFLRNVLIYFDRPTQARVLRRLLGHLRPGGYLFLGSSENLSGLDLPLSLSAPNIYRKTASPPAPSARGLFLQ